MADNSLLSPADIARYFQIESGGNPNAQTGSYRGLGQFGPREEAHFGITDANRADPITQAAAVAQEASENRSKLRGVLGREPTASDYYLAHQQGGAGASALFGNPDMPAWQAIRPFYKTDDMAQKAIMGNIPAGHPLAGTDPNSITSADFSNLWATKFNAAPANNAVASVQPTATPPAVTATTTAPPTGSTPATTNAMDLASLLGGGQNPLQKLGGQLTAQGNQGPQPFKFMESALPAVLPTGPLRPLPLKLA